MRRRAAPALVAATLLGVAVTGGGAVSGAEPDPATALEFRGEGGAPARFDLAALRAACPAERVALDDPYYGAPKQFWALPLACVLRHGLGAPADALRARELLFRARDGYAKPAPGARALEPGGWLAFADAELTPGPEALPRWAPIDRRQLSPAPYYVVWTGGRDPHRYPWPYQLAAVEIVSVEEAFPHAVPRAAAPDSAAWRGFAIFRSECIACHAVNGEGGTVGPELNVPRSVIEYRPREQLREFIRDPSAFRYTSMPANPHLSDADLDALLAYFDAMKDAKRDPRAKNAHQTKGTVKP